MNTYQISHITDLLNVPADRLDACLKDLAQAIPLLRIAVTAHELSEEGAIAQELCPAFTWQDDGERVQTIRCGGATVSLKVKSIQQPVHQPTMHGKRARRLAIHTRVRNLLREWFDNPDAMLLVDAGHSINDVCAEFGHPNNDKINSLLVAFDREFECSHHDMLGLSIGKLTDYIIEEQSQPG